MPAVHLKEKQMILTLTGASGAGKTTIAKELLEKLPIDAQMVPSYTTRKPRDTDIPGEYRYVNKSKFWFLNATGAFIWTVNVHGNSYGTTKRSVIKALWDDDSVYLMVLVLDAIKILRDFAEERGLLDEIHNFYVCSPSQEVLRERLEKRGDSEDNVRKRLADCLKWDHDATNSGIPYEWVRNDSEIQEAVTEIKNCFLVRMVSNETRL